MGRSWEERVQEYVDSERMVHRVHRDDALTCTILGNYGVYHVEVRAVDAEGWREGRCTCPYDRGPCKHMDALLRTYEERPDSFVDLGELLDDLTDRPREELLDLIGEMVRMAPDSVRALGAPGEPSLRELLAAERGPWR